MRREFAMPDVGEGLTEADILTWHVAAGDAVAVNQILVEIETAKAAVELPSPWAGTVGELLAQPGETVEVGAPIMAIETAEAATSPRFRRLPRGTGRRAEGGAKIGEAGADGRIATLVGYGPRPGSVTRRPRRRPNDRRPPRRLRAPGRRHPAELDTGRGRRLRAGSGPTWTGLVPLAKPPVRKLARDLGVDLRAVTGTGAGGVITREDVEAFGAAAREPAPARSAPAASPGGERREPIRGVRKATAAAMVASAFTAPHVTEFLAVDVTATMELRTRLRSTREYADVPLSPLAFVAKAVCLAARRTPEVNAHWDEAAGEIVYYDRVQLGIAAATPRGLIVPTIRDADTLSLRELAVALGELTATARAGRTPPSRPGRRHLHDHQRRGVRGGHRHPDPEPGRGGDPGRRGDQAGALGGRRRAGRAHRRPARAVLRPPAGRRRAGLPVPGRRRGPAHRSRARADLVIRPKRHRDVTPFAGATDAVSCVTGVCRSCCCTSWSRSWPWSLWARRSASAGRCWCCWPARCSGCGWPAARGCARRRPSPRAVTERQVAHVELTDGLLVAAGGVLLFLPGLVTDLAGLLLLLPPIRAVIRRRLVRAAEERAPQLRTARIRARGPVVDGELVDPPSQDSATTPLIIEGSAVRLGQDRAS